MAAVRPSIGNSNRSVTVHCYWSLVCAGDYAMEAVGLVAEWDVVDTLWIRLNIHKGVSDNDTNTRGTRTNL